MAASIKTTTKKHAKNSIRGKIGSGTFLKKVESGCYYFSREYANSFWGKYIYLYQKKGVLRLTSTALIFTSGAFSLEIAFQNISKIEAKVFSRIAKPLRLAYLEITYSSTSQEKIIGLVPAKPTLTQWTVWAANERTREWLEMFEKIPELSPKIVRPLQIPSKSESTKQALLFYGVIAIVVILSIIRLM